MGMGFFSKRPGAAEMSGFDPKKYGTGPLPEAEEAEEEEVVIAGRPALGAGEPSLPVGLLFPGQGSQYVKMMSTVKDIPKVQEMLKQAQSILGYDVLDLCLNGPESKLEQTKFCQ